MNRRERRKRKKDIVVCVARERKREGERERGERSKNQSSVYVKTDGGKEIREKTHRIRGDNLLWENTIQRV